MDRLRLSVLTVATVRSALGVVGSDQDEERLRSRLEDLLANIKGDTMEFLPFGERASATWQSFMRESTLVSCTQMDRQFLAVASSEGLCVVDHDHLYSAALTPLGIKLHNLGLRP